MFKKILGAVLAVLILFLIGVSFKDSHFKYERSGLIHASPEKIFPLISTFEACTKWNPFDQKDPAMKRSIQGVDGQVGSVLTFEGNSDVGAGSLEIVQSVPGKLLELKLKMTRPMKAENTVRYVLTPEAGGTRFSWIMEGDGGYLGKLVSTFIDCEKMMAGDLDKGIANLKKLAE